MTNENVRCGLRLSKTLNHKLSAISKEIGMTKNQLMVKILWEWVRENENENSP